jgi:hypothetical protein
VSGDSTVAEPPPAQSFAVIGALHVRGVGQLHKSVRAWPRRMKGPRIPSRWRNVAPRCHGTACALSILLLLPVAPVAGVLSVRWWQCLRTAPRALVHQSQRTWGESQVARFEQSRVHRSHTALRTRRPNAHSTLHRLHRRWHRQGSHPLPKIARKYAKARRCRQRYRLRILFLLSGNQRSR